jgi:hypothetical protein
MMIFESVTRREPRSPVLLARRFRPASSVPLNVAHANKCMLLLAMGPQVVLPQSEWHFAAMKPRSKLSNFIPLGI